MPSTVDIASIFIEGAPPGEARRSAATVLLYRLLTDATALQRCGWYVLASSLSSQGSAERVHRHQISHFRHRPGACGEACARLQEIQ